MTWALTTKLKKQLNSLAWQYGRTHEERQDIAGRCEQAAWRASQRLDPQYPDPDGYIYRSMERSAVDYKRRDRPDISRESTLCQRDEQIVDHRSGGYYAEVGLYDQFEELSDKDKKLLRMLIEGCSSEEIGLELKLTPGSVRTLVHRRRQEWQAMFPMETLR